MNTRLIQYLSGFLTPERFALFGQVLALRTNYLTVVLEDIFQTQNASAVIRSADCFGIQTVHVIENTHVFRLHPDVVRGASKWVTVKRHNQNDFNTVSALQSLKKEGYRIIAANPHEHDVDLGNFDLSRGKAAFIFGTERPGLSEAAKQHADEFMKIPMVGFTDSLNVSVSVAITLHHLTRRLRDDASINWQLTDQEKDEIMLGWLRMSLKRVDLLEKNFYGLRKD
jgi:tRNA (guanosine-2'-O-)-methyltransferase